MMLEYDNVSRSIVFNKKVAGGEGRQLDSLGFGEFDLGDCEMNTRQGPWFCTLDEVASELGLSREQVRAIEQQALRKCRAFCKANGFVLGDLLAV